MINSRQGLGEYCGKGRKHRFTVFRGAGAGVFCESLFGFCRCCCKWKSADRQCRSLELMDEIGKDGLWPGRRLVPRQCVHARHEFRRLTLEQFEEFTLQVAVISGLLREMGKVEKNGVSFHRDRLRGAMHWSRFSQGGPQSTEILDRHAVPWTDPCTKSDRVKGTLVSIESKFFGTWQKPR